MNWRFDKRKFGVFNLLAAAVLCGALFGFALPSNAQTLTQTRFDDGTGSIGLPPGWRITDVYRGRVACAGPNNSAVILGNPWGIQIPGSLSDLPTYGKYPLARTGDIVTALREVLTKNAQATLLSVSGSPAPQSIRGVPAYYLLYEFKQNGRMMTGLGYFTTLSYGNSTPGWELYSSAVIAPTDQFPQMLPIMMKMWNSWRPNGQEPSEGSSSALFDRLQKEKQLSHERISQEFRKVL
jgi:hypothetical protein